MNDEHGHDGFDRLQHCTTIGAIGGRARTIEKAASSRANIAKARAAKAFYERHPELHPSRRNDNKGAENA